MDNGKPRTSERSIETPVTPPSIKLLDSRNPLSPSPADRMPSTISNVFFAARRKPLIASRIVRQRSTGKRVTYLVMIDSLVECRYIEIHHRDTEDTEFTQRLVFLSVLPLCSLCLRGE